jgi:hypothetical protein
MRHEEGASVTEADDLSVNRVIARAVDSTDLTKGSRYTGGFNHDPTDDLYATFIERFNGLFR